MENQGIPVHKLRDDLSSEGLQVRKDALTLLNDTRKHRISIWNSLRSKEMEIFEQKYDELYKQFIKYDDYISSYLGMASNPWFTDEEGEARPQNLGLLIALNISASGLSSQRENIRNILQDISNQLNGLNSEANNIITFWLSTISLIIALVSLVVSLIALLKA
jgi:hypothetical protein